MLRADGRDYDDAERMAKAFAADTGAEFISPYNDADVIAGAATVALEIFEDAPDVDALVVPIGGGGLISGVAAAAKAIAPACEVIGVEVAASCAFQTSVRAGRLVEIVPGATLADGLGGNPDPETITFGFIQRFVDRIDTVTRRGSIGGDRGARGRGASGGGRRRSGRRRRAGRPPHRGPRPPGRGHRDREQHRPPSPRLAPARPLTNAGTYSSTDYEAG